MLPSQTSPQDRADRKARIARLIVRAEDDSFGGCPSVGEEAAAVIRKHRNRSNGNGGGAALLLPEEGEE
jgi:hypothetical protein